MVDIIKDVLTIVIAVLTIRKLLREVKDVKRKR